MRLIAIPLCILSLALLSSCSSSPDDPAVPVEYSKELATLKQSDELTGSETKYDAAMELFSGVDFEEIKDPDLLKRLLGKPYSSSGPGVSETIEYRYESLAKGRIIRAIFRREGGKISSVQIIKQ